MHFGHIYAFLDTFWTYIGRLEALDALEFGLDTFWTFVWTFMKILRPKCVRTHIVD